MKFKSNLISVLIWNMICLCIIFITGYLGKSNYPIIDAFFALGMFNLLIFLWKMVSRSGFFDLSKHGFSNFWNIVKSAIHKEEFQVKEYDFSKSEDDSGINFYYLFVGLVLIVLSIIIYIF